MDIAKYIDHTSLKSVATTADIIKLCNEAKEFGFASVCVNSCYVPLCVRELAGSSVKVCAVIGFPLGAMSSEAKAFETVQAFKDGADEFDMVINVGALKEGRFDYVLSDIKTVVQAAGGRTVKLIIETGLLTDEEKVKACQLGTQAGVDFVKTCTGFTEGYATPDDIALMKANISANMKVKASGGIKTYEQAMALIEAGASRIGASAGIAIVTGSKNI